MSPSHCAELFAMFIFIFKDSKKAKNDISQ